MSLVTNVDVVFAIGVTYASTIDVATAPRVEAKRRKLHGEAEATQVD